MRALLVVLHSHSSLILLGIKILDIPVVCSSIRFYGFKCVTLTTNDVEHLFIRFSVIRASFVMKWLQILVNILGSFYIFYFSPYHVYAFL